MLKIVSIGFVVVVIIVLMLYIWMTWTGQKALNNIRYAEVDITQVTDGTYKGSTDAGLVKVEIEVKVVNHQMEAINLINHQNGRGSQAETLIPIILEQNTFKVDAISGATLSREAIKGAVSQALIEGDQE